MADPEENKEPQDSKEQESQGKSSRGGLLQWIILAAVVVICSGSGFFLGKILTGSSQTQSVDTNDIDQLDLPDNLNSEDSETTDKGGDLWYYDLDPVVACLDEPDVTRYVRAALTLEIKSGLNQKDGEVLFETKKPVIKDWLHLYLASLTLEDVRGERNLKRIQVQILDALNERLFQDAKPQIKHILFKEFAVQ